MMRILLTVLVLAQASSAFAQARYFPDRFEWQRRTPMQAGMDAAAIDDAIKFAVANENQAPKDLTVAHATSFGANEPFDNTIGPMKTRSPINGLVVRHGYVVAEWGDTKAVDMTFSVTKTFLSTVVGLAWHKGLIGDVNHKARDYMPPPQCPPPVID
jgi:CubicO group peptidase (beta-lactamase class C family)